MKIQCPWILVGTSTVVAYYKHEQILDLLNFR